MNVGNEILTLQFGHYSNYVGTHWLNIQEAAFSYNPNFRPEINNDIIFNEGQSRNNLPAYTPRLLFVDFKGSLGYLQQSPHGEASSLKPAQTSIEVLTKPVSYERNQYLKDVDAYKNEKIPILKNNYDLDGCVNSWSDFLIPSLHHRSANAISGYQLGLNDKDFNCFAQGTALWKSDYFEEDFTDKIRQFMEECDNLQGFHVLLDTHNGFSGLAVSCLEHLREEYDKKSIFCIPLYDADFLNSDCSNNELLCHHLNSMLSISHLCDYSNIILPLSVLPKLYKDAAGVRTFQNVNYKNNRYHTSAIIASVLETLTTPYRLRNRPARMSEIIREVCRDGRLVCSSGMNIPFPMTASSKLFETLDKWEYKWFESLTPEVFLDSELISSQIVSTRGFKNDSLRDEVAASASLNRDNPALTCSTIEEMFKLFFNFTFDNTKTFVSSCDSVLRKPSTFPNVFNQEYNLAIDSSGDWGRISEFRTVASYSSTSEIENFLKALVNPCRSKMVEKMAASSDYNSIDYGENLENIERLISYYNDSLWQL